MAKLFLWVNLLLLFLALSLATSEGEKPTYTDCRPHIDATIRDLAAKAVQAGEEPSDPDSLDYGETQPSETSPESDSEPNSEEDNEPELESEKEEVDEEDDDDEEEEKKEEKKEEEPKEEKYVELKKKHTEKKAHESSKKEKKEQSKKKEKVEKKEAFKSHHKKDSKQHHKRTEHKKSDPPKYQKKDQRAKHHERSASRSESPVRQSTKKSKSKEHDTKLKMGVFDKFIDVVFGFPDQPRNPKYADPWMTHPEFTQTKATESKQAPAKKKVSNESGMIGKSINKIVGSIFGLPSHVKREKKWAKPWQTHQEHSKREEKSEAPKEKKKVVPHKPMFKFDFINKVVEMIFGKVTTKRDPKYAKPWQTHPEFLSDPKPASQKSQSKPKPKPVAHSEGGIINSLITLVFDAPSGKRDPKYAKPWNTHEEHKPKQEAPAKSKKEVKTKKVSTESGVIGSTINKMIYSIFGKPTEPRSKKWKQPWNTHAEHQHLSEDKPKKKVDTRISTESGFIGQLVNKAVISIFGPVPSKRDAKWAKPWVQIKEEEDRAKAKTTKSYQKPEKKSYPTKSESATPEPKEKYRHPSPPPPKQEKKAKPSPKPATPQRKHSPSPSPQPRSPSPSPPPKKEQKSPSPPPRPSPPKKEYSPPEPKSREFSRPKEEPKKSETPAKTKAEPKKKVVVEEDDDDDDGDEEEEVVSTVRRRDHINSILGLDESGGYVTKKSDAIANDILKDLKKIYENAVKPLEKSFKYQDISNRQLSDAELFGTPHVLLLGPYSTGKSSFINYLLGTENTRRALKTGTPPSHGVFRIIQYGEHDRELDGTDVGGQWSFTSLQKFGQNFVDQIKGVALNVPLLKKVTFIEAPGILEMRRPNERLYPFNDVLQWFIDRADLILIMFDYTKLDAGFEMEAILDQLKGREAQARILLNKADQVPPEELIKVQGSLFWNLSPLLGVNSPPVVYAGSFASLPYRQSSPVKLFQAQEEALFHDIAKAISSRVENRVAITRRHAVRVRNHAQMVDSYLTTFRKNKGFLTSKHKLAEDIVENPHDYNIYEGISLQTNVSRYDLPDAEIYRDFFRVHNLYDFRTLKETCGFLGGCPMEKLDAAIGAQLPQLITKYRRQLEGAGSSSKPPSFKTNADSRGAHSQASLS